jgi:DNA (cytosine-5)-methyltransferase 1
VERAASGGRKVNVAPALNILSLCSGIGMLDVGVEAGLEFLGLRGCVVGYVERESYAAAVLLARMEGESLEPAPIWCGDLADLPREPFRGRVDCVTAGFPCQPHSVAGSRKGLDDDRWIWPDILDVIRDVGAWLLVLENVPGLVSSGGLAGCLGDLAASGFDAEWGVLSAASVGASHRRERIFIVAYSDSERRQQIPGSVPPDATGIPWENGGRRGDGELASSVREDVADQPRRGFGIERDASLAGSGRHADGDDSAMDNTAGPRHDGARIGASPDERSGERLSSEGCEAMGDSTILGEREPHDEDGAESRQRARDCAGGASGIMADACIQGHEGRELGRTRDIDRGGAEAHGPTAELRSLPIFAPGPTDPRWSGILRDRPDLSPAVESGVRLLATGLAGMVDTSRADQLRCCGNGVVPLQAGAAFVELMRRICDMTTTPDSDTNAVLPDEAIPDSPAQAGARLADDAFCRCCSSRGWPNLCPSCERN